MQRDCLARLWRDIMSRGTSWRGCGGGIMCRGTAWQGCGGDIMCSRGRWGFLVEEEFRVEVEDGLVCGVVMM